MDGRRPRSARRRGARPMSRVTRPDARTTSAEEMTDIGPGSTVAGLDEQELAVLRRVGGHWGRALGGRRAWLRALPVDPGLHRFPRSRRRAAAAASRRSTSSRPRTRRRSWPPPHAGAGSSRLGRAASTWRRVVLGSPLAASAVAHERMRKPVALAILSSDALSSVAYGPEAMLAVLALAGSGALGLSLWISVAIVVLMVAVGLSYRQLIRAYPHGGGSYIVADKNLGELPALIAAGRPDDRLRADGGRVDLRRCRGDHLGRPRPRQRHRAAGAGGDRDPAGGQPARRPRGRHDLLRADLRVRAGHRSR